MKILSLAVDLKGFHHELRIPLTGIAGMASFLKESNLTETQREQVEAIIECSNRLQDFINNVITQAPVKDVKPYSPALLQKIEFPLLIVFQEDEDNNNKFNLSK